MNTWVYRAQHDISAQEVTHVILMFYILGLYVFIFKIVIMALLGFLGRLVMDSGLCTKSSYPGLEPLHFFISPQSFKMIEMIVL